MPIPAAKSIANQDPREYSGSASSGPSTVSPLRDTATIRAKTTNPATARM